MQQDIRPLLEHWHYEPGRIEARLITDWTARTQLQLRVDLGLLQMELDGRPDGHEPLGYESLFDSLRAVAVSLRETDDSGARFALDPDDCTALHREALQYYHRYLALFQLQDWDRVVRDTERNLAAIDFAEDHATAEDCRSLSRLRFHALLLRTRALAEQALEFGDLPAARVHIVDGIEELKAAYVIGLCAEKIGHSEEISFLRQWLGELERAKPFSQRERLEKCLEAAIRREDFEEAARLRDSLRALGTSASGASS